MKRKSKQTLIICLLIIIFIATVFHIIYPIYKDGEILQGINQKEVTNHYTEDYLVNNKYIKEANLAKTNNIVCDKSNNEQGYVYITENNNIYLNVCDNYKIDYNKIDTSVTNIKKVYYNKLERTLPYYEIVIIDDNNDAYYSAIAYDEKSKKYSYDATIDKGMKTYKDYKIENVENIYIQTIEKSKYYFDEDTSLIFAEKDGTLKMFSSLSEGKLVNIKERIPYFDYVCANTDPICKETTLYITFDNKIVANYNLIETIKNEKGNELTIRDAFSVFDVLDDNYKYEQMKYSDNFNFKYTVYLLSSENDLYKVDLNRKKIDSKKVPVATLYQKGIDTVEHQTIPSTVFENTTIAYKNGKTETFHNVFHSTKVDRIEQ